MDDLTCPACEESGMFTLAHEGGKILARCLNCGDAMEIAIVRCCDLHGRNCEPEEQCCRFCTAGQGTGGRDPMDGYKLVLVPMRQVKGLTRSIPQRAVVAGGEYEVIWDAGPDRVIEVSRKAYSRIRVVES